jgi:deferrochelatase/peroxidase EfeB
VTEEFVAAKMMDRWQDGTSLVRDLAGLEAGREPRRDPDNDFLCGVEDPQGLRCPLGAHIRRANPRDSCAPGSREQLWIANRHRMLRVGRVYDPASGERPGLLFMCVNTDIERQFEFI